VSPKNTADLAQGDDEVSLEVEWEVREKGTYALEWYSTTVRLTLNRMFAAVAPLMIKECSGADLTEGLRRLLERVVLNDQKYEEATKGKELRELTWAPEDLETVIVHLRALGLIRTSNRKRSLKDKGTYWSLTQAGDQLMVQLRALRRPPAAGAPEADASAR
jgi:hypothetical protein